LEEYKKAPEQFSSEASAAIFITALFSAAIGVGLTIGFMGYDLIASIGGTILFMIPAGVVSCVFAGLLTAHYIGNPKWWVCIPVGVILCILARLAGQ
jgi:hypothetical protein